jgi:hypothetical protein
MISTIRVTALAALLTVGLSTATQAQAPKMQATPSLQLSWLSSLIINPTSVPGGTSATGTVTLLRPAASRMEIGLRLIGGGSTDGGVSMLDGNHVVLAVYVPAGSDRATFTVHTTAESAPRTLTIEARYGQELRTATLSTTRPRIPRP